MSDKFKQNSLNLAISSLVILSAYFVGLGNLLFWFGGLYIIPAIALWFQVKYSLGSIVTRVSVAALPWLVTCGLGLLWAANTEHEGQRTMNMWFFEMPLYSVAIGSVIVVFFLLINKFKQQS